jgi:digeranylgeranylglycerophospholipid reductase
MGGIARNHAFENQTMEQAPPRGRVAVVGGSAAGLFAASLLARAGRPVQVFEQAEDLAPAPRTLIVTHRMRELLGRAGEPAIVNEIRQFEIFTDGRAATIPLERPDLVIERATLLRSLAEEARQAGAELLLGRRFVGLESGSDAVKLAFERSTDGRHEEATAETVIGADGATSRVALAAGWTKQPTVPLIQAAVSLPCDLPPDTVRVWFVPDDTPYFYWLIPDAPGRGVIGLIGEEGNKTRRALECFLEKRNLTPLEFQGARTPLYQGWLPIRRQVGQAEVYLVGDAAAQVKVTTVGGIVTGLRGALAAARAILQGRFDGELRALRRELGIHLVIRRALHNFTQKDYSRLLDLLDSAARDSLGKFSRDEAARILWRLCLRRPGLVWLGLRGLLTEKARADNAE